MHQVKAKALAESMIRSIAYITHSEYLLTLIVLLLVRIAMVCFKESKQLVCALLLVRFSFSYSYKCATKISSLKNYELNTYLFV